MKREIIIKTPEIVIKSDLYAEDKLVFIQGLVERELLSGEWYKKYEALAKEIFKTAIEKWEAGERLAEQLNHDFNGKSPYEYKD